MASSPAPRVGSPSRPAAGPQATAAPRRVRGVRGCGLRNHAPLRGAAVGRENWVRAPTGDPVFVSVHPDSAAFAGSLVGEGPWGGRKAIVEEAAAAADDLGTEIDAEPVDLNG